MTDNKKDNPQNQNMALWEAVEKTDPKYTKQFDNGNFKGTSTTALYTIKKATAQWGIMGDKWGATELEHMVIDGIWFSKVQVWHPTGKVEQWGATKFKYETKGNDKYPSRTIIDEEAAKKAYTDALTKCLSYLGFCADIHLGLFDDNKYVAKVKAEFAEQETPPPAPTATFETDKQYLLAAQDVESLKTYFDGVKKRKDSFHDYEYAELVTITTNKNKQFKGEL